MEKEQNVPLIPRETLFGNPDKAMTRISPDGAHLAFLAPVNGVLNVWVGPAGDIAAARPVTHDTYRGIRQYFWAYTNRHILYLQDRNGDENWRVYSVDLETANVIDLTPLEGVAAVVQQLSHRYPQQILVGLNDRDPHFHDLYLISLGDGHRTLVYENHEFAEFTSDMNFKVRFGAKMTEEGGAEVFQYEEQDENWTPFMSVPMEDLVTTGLYSLDKTGELLYLLDSRGRDTAALFVQNLATGNRDILAEDPRADITSVFLQPTEHTFQAARATYDRERWYVSDEAFQADLERLRKVSDGELDIVSRTLDDSQWVAAFLRDNGPTEYYLYDRGSKQAHFLFNNREDLSGLALAKMYPVVIQARDGLNLVCYYSLPVEADANGDGLPDQPVPMVLLVHGGPWARDQWGYDPFHQWLANRGYAVLSVNYRGSTGFGKAFVNASTREWAGKMHDDLIDAVAWAVKNGIADAQRVGIMGGSYGGYATLVGLTFTPETFACGVDIVGPSSIITLLKTIPPYWEPQVNLFISRVGDFRSEEGQAFLRSRSPLTYVERIVRPLLIGQGANDPRVKQAEADQIVQAMQEKNIPVTYVLYPDEGHGFARPQNRLSFFAVAEAFLSEYLGGRFQPVGDDFQGSTITVPVGAEHVPGLEDALQGQKM